MYRSCLLLLAVCVCWTSLGRASEQAELFFESVGDAESIPDNNVSALAQDAQGFLWIGTPDGLIRYDGYRFRRFDNDPAGADAPGGHFVRALLRARDGRLWVGTNADGVSVLATDEAAVRRIRAGADGLSSNTVRALAEDARGGIYIGTREGLDYWDPASGRIEHFADRHGADTSSDENYVLALLVDRRGDLWIGSAGGLGLRRAGSGRFERVLVASDSGPSLRGEPVQALLERAQGDVIVGTARRGSFVVDSAASSLRQIPMGAAGSGDALKPAVLSLLQPQPGVLWVAAFGGIDVIDANDFHLLRRIRPDPAVGSSLAHDQVRALLLDRSGQVWVGGYGGGLQRHDPANGAIGVLRHSPNQPHSLSVPSVSSVLELADGRWWIGTRGNGIDVWERQRGVVAGFRVDAGDPGALRNGVISSLAQDVDGTLWVGTVDGLHRHDARSGSFVRFGPEHGLPDIYVRRLLAGSEGTLWVGTDAGLARLPRGSQRIERLLGADGAPVRDDINAIIEVADGRVLAGGSTGMFVASVADPVVRKVNLHAAIDGAPVAIGVLGLLKDSQARLWVDTAAGLYRLLELAGESARIDSVGERLGAVGQPFGANLLEDGLGRIWSQRFLYDPRADSLYELGRADGADLGTPWFRAYARTRDGLLLFGGSKGLMVIDPMRFRRWEYEPPLVVAEIRVGGRSLPLVDPAIGFEVRPHQRSFSVEFAALDFTAPLRNRYQYRLLGFDADWIDSDATRRVASYTSLGPGRYTLEVRGSGRTGVYSRSELKIPVRVLPAAWQTWWFRTLALLASVLLLAAGVRWQTLRMRRRAAQLERLVDRRTAELSQAKTRAEQALLQLQSAQDELVAREKMASLGQLVAGVAHEINTPVGVALTAASYLAERSEALRRALAAGQLHKSELSQFIEQAQEASSMIGHNLTRASELVRSFKQVSVDRSSDDRRRFDLGDNLRAIVHSLELTWKRRPVQLQLECEERIELDSYPGALGQVVTNLIQNALLHAFDGDRSGVMRLCAKFEGADRVRIVFEDDGHGIAPEQLARVFEPFYTTRRAQGGSGLGLHIVYNLVTVKLGGRIEAQGEPGSGMRFVLLLPLRAP
ncbi:MAG: hypothetical protein IT479_14475 [Xanthomonadales bacterium]|nr:Adaptive-response sensory-kinase SasA [Xanthomonadales bacterium]MCC6594467.1 hypothetical protein [Xanthomonadales bacterium]MCE7932430.1 hypothetical protein [Xanthomonadales bacterium PRO6]